MTNDFESAYLVGGPRDNEMVSVPRGGAVATVAQAGTIRSVDADTEPRYDYARSPLPDGWPTVFAFASDADDAWPVERVMDKLAYRGKAPSWLPSRR